MLQSIVGPPMVGATELKPSPDKMAERDFKGAGSGASFGKTFEEKMTSKNPKETKESPAKEMRQADKTEKSVKSEKSPGTDQTDKSEDSEKPQQLEGKKAETPVAKPDGKISRKATDRQKAIQEFMDSFESEFQISPTRLVEAMAKLDDTQLAQSPEATADAVIDQLGLSDEDADKARAMYASLLLQLGKISQPQAKPLPTQEFAVGAGVSQQQTQARILAAQEKQSALGASADRVTKSFWMRQEPKELPASPEGLPTLNSSSLAQRVLIDEAPEGVDAFDANAAEVVAPETQESLPALPPHLQGQMKETVAPSLMAALMAKQAAAQAQGEALKQQEAPEETSQLMDEFQQAVQAPQVPKGMTNGQGMAAVQPKVTQEFFQNQSQGQSLMQQNSQGFAQKGMGQEKEAVAKLVEKASDFKQSMTGLEGLHANSLKGESLKLDAAAPMAAMATPAPANATENEAAVKQIMNQAQYLIKKGGGEMKVQMTPEGMGTIHLKVMLQDGKVNLQMSADTQEAKKTIESSLAELKTSLAAHKLSMENVKVDVVNSTSADTATQNQTNTNGQNQRDQTRQFWNQFNENFGSQGRKESFADMPNLRGYGQRSRDPLAPIESSSKARARTVEGKGSGLNLVA